MVGNGDPSTCSESALDAALVAGGDVTFNCGTKPYTITVTTPKVIAADTRLDDPRTLQHTIERHGNGPRAWHRPAQRYGNGPPTLRRAI